MRTHSCLFHIKTTLTGKPPGTPALLPASPPGDSEPPLMCPSAPDLCPFAHSTCRSADHDKLRNRNLVCQQGVILFPTLASSQVLEGPESASSVLRGEHFFPHDRVSRMTRVFLSILSCLRLIILLDMHYCSNTWLCPISVK